ncbi:MAG: Asp-tRNA(Asn)/Glu-tRNA(Gln) amidotransferase subunit GatA [Dehalococcoidia bacterium]|jgi:aspartyl-tRNA(Asn)/glutamyl-tRNA(Gln) amidotransferase subunit A|nr:Asp-tRNA(Asn)/Glu-tRNA(Gln) amidotransferase subunit GatA [Dehalococcoidia bacterium]
MFDRRDISSVEATRAMLDRIESLEPELNSFITVTPERALKEAELADQRLRGSGNEPTPLTGVPVMVKDNFSTEGVETTAASDILRGYIPPYDGTAVQHLKEAGAVILGKGNLDEFAMGSSNENSAFGPVQNPWDTERVPGGSSGGPSVAVAAGECFVSFGSDTGGSIRQPAALCGIVGMKPTYGLVSRYGLLAFGSSLDQIGPLARSVADCADALNVVSSHDLRDSTSVKAPFTDFGQDLETGITGLKIGVPKEYLVDGIEPGVRSAFEASLKTLEDLGAEISETSLPLTDHALAVYYIIAPSEASANLSRYDGVKYGLGSTDSQNSAEATQAARGEGFGDEVKRRIFLGTYALSAGYYDAYYKKAQQVRTLIRREFTDAFLEFDALVTPTSPGVAFKIGDKVDDPFQMYMNDVCTIPVNIAGLPGISIPGGVSQGLPVGLQFIGPQFGDTTVIRAAAAYERATSWHLNHPVI